MIGNVGKAMGILVVSIFVGGSARAAAGDVLIDGDEQTGVRDCKGSSATVNGNQNQLTFTNCARVVVNGNKNTLTLAEGSAAVEVMGNKNSVALDKAESIKVLGNDNVGTWKAPLDPKKKKPAIANLGKRNTISQAK